MTDEGKGLMERYLMERVIVLLEPSYFRHDESGRFAARFLQLGLTSFGNTHEEALESLKRLFVTFVRVRRENGTLEGFLNAADVEWYPESKYPSSKGEVEYLVGSPMSSKAADLIHRMLLSGWKSDEANRTPALAA